MDRAHSPSALQENAELQEYVMTRLKRKVNRNANFNTIHSDRSIPQ